MKKIAISIIIASASLFTSCSVDSWLKEEPLDFMTPDNAYQTTVQFRQSLNFLYDAYRNLCWNSNEDFRVTLFCTDYAHGGYDFPDMKYNNFKGWITPESSYVQTLWTTCYNAIGNANVILGRLPNANEISDTDKATIRGEALFFRAFYYRILANMYGGVPLVTEELNAPKRDFTRNTRAEVYEQCRADLEEAVSLLKDIDQAGDGYINKQAGQHLLTEIYICTGQYEQAVQSASAVINHPSMALMTDRFGSRKDEPGDTYWDLFRVNNQNRSSSGNTESIWVLQYEYQNAGSSYNCNTARQIIPGYYSIVTESAEEGKTVPAFTTWTAEKGGRGIGAVQPNPWFFEELWDDAADMRNSDYNIIKDFRIDNPAAKGYGQWFVKDGWLRESDKIRLWYPFIQKFSRTNNYPAEAYAKNADGTMKLTALGEHGLLNSQGLAHGSFKDEYAFRLAETYLLRAEAYLGANNKEQAAADINTVRIRANAAPITAAQVDIDYILDERMRELYSEEIRIITLCRLGKMVERTRKYNLTGYNIGDHQNLWPIPYGEIEKNILATIEQNPGYN
ncbi:MULTISPECIES: RagB/SusD family nutrient uptake outer membrane protein [unclassified Parabacteroides]|uniref:RagB/SusD family nutrient uptake outer membrane protein n=1 Tax=unclassified Parabacteroides TaxID=2649774 RepID=UPI002476BE96|nr:MULTISPECIES: RagB/SusD family nutrient uptake outer membrane protein [unclassified Parabacteroides]